jgi:hypothetical protein
MSNGMKVMQAAIIIVFGIIFETNLTNQALGGGLLDKATGKVEVQDQTLKGEQPTKVPQTIIIKDFELASTNLDVDEGVLNHLATRRRVPILRQKNDPEQEARKLVNLMSKSLQKKFENAGITAQRIDSVKGLPKEGWLVRGVFTEVDEGGRMKRAVIGFGAGATSMEVQVSVTDLAVNPDAPFIIFGTVKDPKQMPGAVVTRNPYVAAAKFVLEKNASEKDVTRTAKEIVQEIQKYREKLTGSPSSIPPTN